VRVRRGFLNWGIFLVCLGLVPLTLQLNLIDRELAGALLRLWPLILIGAGIGLLLRFSRGAVLGGVIVAATCGLLAGSLLGGGSASAATACAGGDATGQTQSHNGTTGPTLILNVDLTCGDMNIARAPGGTWQVDVRAGSQTPSVGQIGSSLNLRSASGAGLFLGRDERESWQVTLPSDTNLSTNLTVSAGTLRANLGNGALSDVSATFNAADAMLDMSTANGGPVSLSATVNAASVSIILPPTSLTASITMNAGALKLCAAPDLGLRVSYEQTLGSSNFSSAGLIQSGGTWQSANYLTAPNKAELRINANVSSTTLNPEGGCQ
jgi:hypothetical protein